MSHAHETMTPDEFLAWEAKQDRKWEFDGFRPVAMTGGSANHNTIQGNVITSLRARLRGGPCRAYGPDLRVPTGSGRYRYPDALVTCTPVSGKALDAPEPVVLFEVLSESTARHDETVKLIEYRSIPSVRRYVLLDQDDALVTVIARIGEIWSIDVLRIDDNLRMPEIDIEVPVRDLYADVELPA